MKMWWTTTDLAAASLPRVSTSPIRIGEAAEREGWISRARKGRGGGKEYHVSSLPAAAQRALAKREAAPEMAVERRRATRLDEVKPEVAGTAIAREKIVKHTLALAADGGKIWAIRRVVADAAAVDLPPSLQAYVEAASGRAGSGLSERTLRRWVDAYKGGGERPAALATRDGRVEPPPLWLLPFLKLWARPTKPSIAQVYEEDLAGALPEGVPMPGVRAVYRAVAALPAVERARGRHGPRELKRFRPYVIRDFADLMPGDVYTADGHCHDQEVVHPVNGRPHRPEIITVFDVATRRAVGWAAGHAESAQLVADGLRRACGICIPAIWYTDGGSGFQADRIRDPDVGLLARLGIRPETSLPYNSQARGAGERPHKSVWIRAAKKAPGYVGKDMDPEARKRVYTRSRRELAETGTTRVLMLWDEFRVFGDDKIAAYNARPHSALPRVRDGDSWRHLSPDEAWAAKAAEADLVTPRPDELDSLFRPVEIRTVTRGLVSLGARKYFASALEYYHGEQVEVAYDPHDPALVWIRQVGGPLICEARLDANKAPYFPPSVIDEAREQRARAQIRRLDRKREDIEAALPAPASQIAYTPAPMTDQERADRERLVAEINAPQTVSTSVIDHLPDDPYGAYRAWLEVGELIEAGTDVSDRDRHWHRTFVGQIDWRVGRDMAEARAAFAASQAPPPTRPSE